MPHCSRCDHNNHPGNKFCNEYMVYVEDEAPVEDTTVSQPEVVKGLLGIRGLHEAFEIFGLGRVIMLDLLPDALANQLTGAHDFFRQRDSILNAITI